MYNNFFPISPPPSQLAHHCSWINVNRKPLILLISQKKGEEERGKGVSLLTVQLSIVRKACTQTNNNHPNGNERGEKVFFSVILFLF